MDYTSIIDFVDYLYMRERKCSLILLLRAHSCAKLGQRVDIMAKTKWIVPAIAMVLCAASLIGAGYAAYSATLTDTESITATNNYIKLDLGRTPVAASIAIDYQSNAVYENGAFKAVTYSPQSVDAVKLITFTVTESTGGTADSSGYSLILDNVVAKDGDPENPGDANFTLTTDNIAVKLHDTDTPADLDHLTYGATYDLYLSYTHNANDDLKYKVDGYSGDGYNSATVVASASAAATAVAKDMVATIAFDLIATAI